MVSPVSYGLSGTGEEIGKPIFNISVFQFQSLLSSANAQLWRNEEILPVDNFCPLRINHTRSLNVVEDNYISAFLYKILRIFDL